jgi:5-methylcytosine-specific restriction endonuclease McrA
VKVKTKRRRSYIKPCDVVFRACIVAMFKSRCAVCGAEGGQLHVHHLISRARHFFRHNLMNGILLCPRCHVFNADLSAHGAPWAFEDWMKTNRPEQYEWWAKNRTATIPQLKIDYQAVRMGLLDALKGLEAAQ